MTTPTAAAAAAAVVTLPPPTAPIFTPAECGARSDHWSMVPQTDPHAIAMYRRHYSAKKNGATAESLRSNGFVGPGETMVLMTPDASALFAWRKERWRMDGQQGVNCSVFRREEACTVLSSTLIRDACRLAWDRWPGHRLFTFVNPAKVRVVKRRGVPVPGFCFIRAGWSKCGESAGGLVILEVLP